jgi:hypothetical protein
MAVAVSDLGTVEDTGNDSQSNFSFGSFGAEASDRYLIALISGRDGANNFTASSVTIGGVSASIAAQVTNTNTAVQSVIAIAAVPTGASGSVVVDWSEALVEDQVCTLLRVTGLASATAYDTDSGEDTANDTSLAGTIDCEAGGLVVAISGNTSNRTSSWSLANEVSDQATTDGGVYQSAAYEIFASAQTGLSVTNTLSGPSNNKNIAIAAFSPVTSVAYTLDCDAGTFTLTGQAAALTTQFKTDADRGTFTLTGIDAELKQGYGIVAEVGSFTLTSYSADLTAAQSLLAEAGAFTLTGNDADLSAGYQIAADLGAFTLTGFDAGFAAALSIAADAGAYSLTGQDAGLVLALTLAAEAGTYTLTGNDVTLTFSGWSLLPGEGTWTNQTDTATWVVQASGGNWTVQDGTATWVIQPNSGSWTVQ